MAEQKPIRGWKARQERAKARRRADPEREKIREIRRRHLLGEDAPQEAPKQEPKGKGNAKRKAPKAEA